MDNDEHKEVPASVVVNFSITQDPDFYRNASKYNSKYLIGPAYFWFDELLHQMKPVCVAGPEVERCFLNQGGSDPYGLTLKIIRSLELWNFEQEFHVVSGGLLQAEHKSGLKNISNSLKGDYKFYTDLSKLDLYRLMEKSDLAISAAGNTLYELAFLGVPTLVISHDQLHDRVAAAFEQKGAVVNVGIGTQITEAQIAAAIRQVIDDRQKRVTLNENARSLFINRPGASLVDELVGLYSP